MATKPLPPPPPKPCDPNDHCRWTLRRTEHQDNYVPHLRRAPKMTREAHMNRYLWQTIHQAYVQRLEETERRNRQHSTTSEYGAEYHRVPTDHSKADQKLQNAYPLYGTAAVTIWSPVVVNASPFKMANCMSKPNAECLDMQFR